MKTTEKKVKSELMDNMSIKKEFYKIKDKGFDFLDSDKAENAVAEFNKAWELLPSPKVHIDESYSVAAAFIETYIALEDYKKALEWADTLQKCDLERYDDGDREFNKGVALFESGNLTEAKKWFVIANEKSEGVAFEDQDPKYKKLLKSK